MTCRLLEEESQVHDRPRRAGVLIELPYAGELYRQKLLGGGNIAIVLGQAAHMTLRDIKVEADAIGGGDLVVLTCEVCWDSDVRSTIYMPCSA